MLKKSIALLLVAVIAASALDTLGTTTRQDATGYNQQQKLDRVTNSSSTHAVWHDRITADTGSFTAYWSYYNGTGWTKYDIPTDSLDIGSPIASAETAYPTVAVTGSGKVGFAYLISAPIEPCRIDPDSTENRPPLGHFVIEAAAYESGGWKKYAQATTQQAYVMAGPPVIAVQDQPGDSTITYWLAFCEYDKFDSSTTWEAQLLINRYTVDYRPIPRFNNSYSSPIIIDNTLEGGNMYEIKDISIAADDSGNAHGAYVKDGDLHYFYLNSSGTFYGSGPVELNFSNVSTPQLSVYGDSVHIVYREGADRIKLISRQISPLNLRQWEGPFTLDARTGYASYRPYRKDKADIWQEEDGNSVLEAFDPDYYLISQQ